MFPILAAGLPASFTNIPVEFWFWITATLLMTAAVGFAAGVAYAKLAVKRTVKRAKKHVSKLYGVVVESLDHAQEACSALETFPNLQLTQRQTSMLENLRLKLLEIVTHIVDQQHTRIAEVKQKKAAAIESGLTQLASRWVREPVDMTTSLPVREAFDQNLQSLLELGTQTEFENGVLIVKIDKFDQLKSRFGHHGAEKFLKKVCSLVCASLRTEDIVCRFSSDSFGVLLPNVDEESGRKIAVAVRDAIRNHHFRLEESGPEILVTASFGMTACLPHDSPDLVLNRVTLAVSSSERRGRNQLHLHDGDELLYCKAI